MDSSIIGKIEKARHYAEQKDRVNITSFAAKGHHAGTGEQHGRVAGGYQ